MNGSILLGIAHITLAGLSGVYGLLSGDVYLSLLAGVNLTLGALWIRDGER